MPTDHRRPSSLRRLRWHFEDHGWIYGGFLFTLIAFGGLLLFADIQRIKGAEEANEVAIWPEVEATVIRSRISEVNTSGETHFSTRLSVTAKLEFFFDGKRTEADYVASWGRSDNLDWSRVLAPGSKIKIRVSPIDRSRVSLLDLNGVP